MHAGERYRCWAGHGLGRREGGDAAGCRALDYRGQPAGRAHPQSHVRPGPGQCAEQVERRGGRSAGPAVSQGPRRGFRARSNDNREQPAVPSSRTDLSRKALGEQSVF